jgi:hypothetical protein
VIAREGERFHRPIGGRSTRPEPALLLGDACSQMRGGLTRNAPDPLDELGIPQVMQVVAGEPVSRDLLPIAPGIVIVGSVKGLMHIAEEMQEELQRD